MCRHRRRYHGNCWNRHCTTYYPQYSFVEWRFTHSDRHHHLHFGAVLWNAKAGGLVHGTHRYHGHMLLGRNDHVSPRYHFHLWRYRFTHCTRKLCHTSCRDAWSCRYATQHVFALVSYGWMTHWSIISFHGRSSNLKHCLNSELWFSQETWGQVQVSESWKRPTFILQLNLVLLFLFHFSSTLLLLCALAKVPNFSLMHV